MKQTMTIDRLEELTKNTIGNNGATDTIRNTAKSSLENMGKS